MNEYLAFGGPWMWVGFFVFVLLSLLADLYLLGGRKDVKISLRAAFIWSCVWIALALLFAVFVWWDNWVLSGPEIAAIKTQEYLTGYLIEKSLSIDNLFVFLLIFRFFHVPAEYQRKVLVIGVVTAVVLRTVLILVGAALISRFHWLLYVFGVFLCYSGVKMFFIKETEFDLSKNWVLRFFQKYFRVSQQYYGSKFWVKIDRSFSFTPLFVVLVMVEVTDVIFALDSIPAIFAITQDPFIVLTSNVFAILGLRALYFLLADFADRFYLLKYGLAAVLVLIGLKMLVEPWYAIPALWSLALVGVLIGASMLFSWLIPKPK